jgi:methylmalonyl-CoA/ethylmalonyl-CoA epimerase
MTKIKRVNHIAIAVKDIDSALIFWCQKLGMELDHVEEIALEGVKVAFLPVGESAIELIEPLSDDSAVGRYLEKHGAGMHHLCVEVDDIESALADLKAQGVRLINQQPRRGRDGRLYAFIHPKSASGVLVELYQLAGDKET